MELVGKPIPGGLFSFRTSGADDGLDEARLVHGILREDVHGPHPMTQEEETVNEHGPPYRLWLVSFTVFLLLGVSQSLSAQGAVRLTPGDVVQGVTDAEGSAVFEFPAGSAGVLTVVARSLDGADLVLLVTDQYGQPLPGGRSDQDLGGNSGAEQFAFTISRAGDYRIRVETFGGSSASFQVGASWLSFPDLELPPDPDGSPASATPIQVGQDAHQDTIDGTVGDYWDWYVLVAEEAGTVTVTTRAEDGDLVLEAFEDGEYVEALERSDQDLQELGGNEALTLVVDAGQTFYFKVASFSEGASVSYRLQVGFIPN